MLHYSLAVVKQILILKHKICTVGADKLMEFIWRPVSWDKKFTFLVTSSTIIKQAHFLNVKITDNIWLLGKLFYFVLMRQKKVEAKLIYSHHTTAKM